MSESFKGLKGYWTLFTEDNSPLPADHVLAPFIAVNRNRIWINVGTSRGLGVPAMNYGLFLTNGANWSEYRLGEHGLPSVAAEYMATDSRDRLWLSVPYVGICCFDGHLAVIHAFEQLGLPTQTFVTDLHVDELDQVWIATLGHGVYRFLDGSWERAPGSRQILSDYVTTFGVDRGNHLWLACEDVEETRFVSRRSGSWESVCSFPMGLGHQDDAVCFTVDRDEKIWVGRRWGGLMVWDGQRWQRLTERDCPHLYGEIQSLTIDESDNLWVGTAGGYAIFDGGRWHDWGAIHPGTSDHPVSREDLLSADPETVARYVYIGGFVAIDSVGRKWIDSAKGLVMFAPQGRQQQETDDNLDSLPG